MTAQEHGTRYRSVRRSCQSPRNLADSIRKQGFVLGLMFRKCWLFTSQRRDYSGTSWQIMHPPCCVVLRTAHAMAYGLKGSRRSHYYVCMYMLWFWGDATMEGSPSIQLVAATNVNNLGAARIGKEAPAVVHVFWNAVIFFPSSPS
jgi:hypothetical protein